MMRLCLRIERKVESVNRFRTGREGMKARDIEQKYPPEKAKKLMAALRARNLFYWDEDFPGDEEVGERPKSMLLGYGPQKEDSQGEIYTPMCSTFRWKRHTHTYIYIYLIQKYV